MRKAILHIVLVSGLCAHAQGGLMGGDSEEVSLATINFSSIPNLGGTEVTNYGLNLNFGIPLRKSMVGFSLSYQNFDFSFNESTNLIDLSSFENIDLVRANVSFIKPLKNSLNLMVSGGTALMSNLESGITSEDFVFNAIVGAIKKWGNDNRNTTLFIGALYGTQFGEPRLLPAVSLSQKLNQYWSYSLGIPTTGITYRPNNRHRFSLFASPQGLFGNNSKTLPVDGDRLLTNTKLQFNGINTRLLYQYRFTKHLAVFVEGGFVPNAVLKVLDNDNNEILDLDPDSGSYINAGLRFVVQRPKNNDLKKARNEN
ncbi:DUF6268 family outer membrane beta-barrel protein [Muricauda sp. SCSIO 64092]|uniref:DUF6268 family outer membrane beta-barrel protein n=1 Tax=Allomuricauda sp. SCSIO 64092 TaxID=2908842 RepID=UPI001FF29E09|nr:DUF6268 family outer membrane beta-barrel protein [Muricauda sp. SCSIO 64092]UOY08978.1 DUF6268 family outer membrane beta-barrel protein [Muricauda sp. SCSIO 64092]